MQRQDAMVDRREQLALTGPVVRTFLYFTIPSLIGVLAITTASVVDAVFVGHFVGPEALAAIVFLVPYFTLLFGSCLMIAVGGVVRAGKHLGEGNSEAASAVFSTCVLGVLLLSAVAAALSSTFDETLYGLLGAPPHMMALMRSYFRVISPILILQLVTMLVYYFVRLGGRPVRATAALVIGAVANVAGDALLVGHLGWGLAGAAWSTGFAQLLQLGILLTHFRGERQLRFALALRPRELWRSALCGVSEFVNEISGGVLIFAVNWLMLERVGVDGVAAFAAVNYSIFISLMIFYGIADALHVLISTNLGAGNLLRIKRFISLAASCVFAVGVALSSLSLLWGESWLSAFLGRQTPEALGRAQDYLGLVWPLFLVNGANVLTTVYLTALQRPALAGTLALSRTLILPIGYMLLVAFWLPEEPFLAALPLAEWTAFMLALGLLFKARLRSAPGYGGEAGPVVAS